MYSCQLTPAIKARRLALLTGAARPVWAAPTAVDRPYPGAAPCNTSLQACIDGATAGDTIVIAANTYITSFTLNKAVSLTGVASTTVILQALPDTRVLEVTGAAISNSVVISGLTFTGGSLAGSNCSASCGGGVLLTGLAQPLLVNVIITGNSAWDGGGLYAASGSLLRMTNSQVLSNTSANAGGGALAIGAAVVNGGLFQGNQCTEGGCQGGGLRTFSTLALTGTQFLSNTARLNGGGVLAGGAVALTGGLFQGNQCILELCQGSGLNVTSELTLSDTAFLSNTGAFRGGGLYASGPATLTGWLFEGNQCSQLGCSGGGLYANSTLTLTRAQFINNSAIVAGGGLYLRGGAGGASYLANSLFANNTATTGAALYLNSTGGISLVHVTIAAPAQVLQSAVTVDGGSVGIANTLFANYVTGIHLSAGSAHEDCNLFSNVMTPTTGGVTGGANSFAGAAAFVEAGGGDYHLTPASDAIDAGTDAWVDVDFAGQVRPVGAGFDIGYDEWAVRLYLPIVIRQYGEPTGETSCGASASTRAMVRGGIR